MDLDELQRIRQWHARHRNDHPVEYHLWDAMLTLWLAGWVGCIPAWVLEAEWAFPLCLAAISAPSLYVAGRLKAHRARKLRCDWAR
ncbi:hypothetical protein [Ramlibacter sp.]|uniref:hypothetical protein n=1 Tax=Ramlibacter sp. TaxID=1917967 RepID=UPI003D0D218E